MSQFFKSVGNFKECYKDKLKIKKCYTKSINEQFKILNINDDSSDYTTNNTDSSKSKSEISKTRRKCKK